MDNNNFEYSDAWILTSLFMYDSKFKELILTNVIANGDALNHAIFTIEELNTGFNKLINANLIQYQNYSIRLTELGLDIKEKVSKDKGGFFEQISNTLKRLRRLNFTSIRDNVSVYFNESDLEDAYYQYKINSQKRL